ncbi:MAG: metallophosphoesterase [Ignavibacteria bacterium]
MKRLIISLFVFVISINCYSQDSTLHFIAIGDWGRQGNHLQKETAETMGNYAESFPVKFIVSTGDNFYEYGIKSVEDSLIKLSFDDIYTATSLQVPWYITFGNHDYGYSANAQIELSKFNIRWKFPSSYYSIDEELADGTRIQFLFVDTNPFIEKYRIKTDKNSDWHNSADQLYEADWQQQLKWLESSLKNCDADWKIVIGHHPVLSGGKHGSIKEINKYFKPLFEKYGVQMYICGHDHDIQFLKENSVNYFVSGAGSELRKTNLIEQSVFARSIIPFCQQEFTAVKRL